ncbi:MAG: tetratricopeptide repeat protein [Chlorobiaceae bacterium]|nr:tetratricopeptide repeat protein [Chlorobiaceae bacterium]
MSSPDPKTAARFQQALSFHQKGELAEARAIYEEISKIDPGNANVFHLLGVIASQQQNHQIALILIDHAISLNPIVAAYHSNRGLALHNLKRFREALESYDRAIQLRPDYAEALSNRGLALSALNRFDEALDSFNRAIRLQPGFADAHSNRGNTLRELNRYDEALESYNRAIQLKPDFADAYLNASILFLKTGNFEKGWRLYERRWDVDSFGSPRRNFAQPLWLGQEPLNGKTILLHGEQGLGDTIQFCRYVKMTSELGAKVVLEVETPLLELLRQLEGVSRCVAKGDALPPFDVHCPLMSLPLAFRTTLETIPYSSPYLSAEPGKSGAWAKRIGENEQPLTGVVWSGSASHKNDRNRSIPLATLLSALPEGFRYVSLQKEVGDSDREALESHSGILHFGNELKDFSDTAALCGLMDVVICVDTSVAHLSAAMGKPTWILLPYVTDWRWLTDRTDCPWYRSARLYRQQAIGDWSGILQKVKEDLLQTLPMG